MAFRMVIEPGNPARHSPQIKNKGIRKRQRSTPSATSPAQKVFTSVWPSNEVLEAPTFFGRQEATPAPSIFFRRSAWSATNFMHGQYIDGLEIRNGSCFSGIRNS